MVKAYIAKYGGTASDINADVAEGYSVGEVLAAAVTATKSVDNSKIISYLHSGVTLQTVQGPAKFDSVGENVVAQTFIFQWQDGQQVRPGAADQRDRLGGDRQPQAELGQLTWVADGRCAERQMAGSPGSAANPADRRPARAYGAR